MSAAAQRAPFSFAPPTGVGGSVSNAASRRRCARGDGLLSAEGRAVINQRMDGSFELFDHTADVGVIARAAELRGLVWPAAMGLYEVIGDVQAGGETNQREFHLAGEDAADMLRDFLAELLFEFEQHKRRLTHLYVEAFDEHRLDAIASLAIVDDQRSTYYREVKAVTYHELSIKQVPGGYEARYILDI